MLRFRPLLAPVLGEITLVMTESRLDLSFPASFISNECDDRNRGNFNQMKPTSRQFEEGRDGDGNQLRVRWEYTTDRVVAQDSDMVQKDDVVLYNVR